MYSDKLGKAIMILKPYNKYVVYGELNTEEDFNKIGWVTGENNGQAITTTTNPHPELTWTKVKAKMDEVDAEYDSLAYARNRADEYPSIQDFMEAYTEKEIGGDSTKWDLYVTKYNKVRTDNPKS